MEGLIPLKWIWENETNFENFSLEYFGQNFHPSPHQGLSDDRLFSLIEGNETRIELENINYILNKATKITEQGFYLFNILEESDSEDLESLWAIFRWTLKEVRQFSSLINSHHP
ncbi:MAG: hypothetical protein NZL96_00495 [Patescibacteria group bacterium]|nr:hypothetical protein [Patescibacteria group bacterium]